MIRNIAVGIAVFIIGFSFGIKYHSKNINNRILYLRSVLDEIKTRNNKMVKNLALVYRLHGDVDPDSFNEVDEMLMDMWID